MRKNILAAVMAAVTLSAALVFCACGNAGGAANDAAGETAAEAGGGLDDAGASGGNVSGGVAAGDPQSISSELVWTESMELEYADCFTVDRYEDGFALITIQDADRYLLSQVLQVLLLLLVIEGQLISQLLNVTPLLKTHGCSV